MAVLNDGSNLDNAKRLRLLNIQSELKAQLITPVGHDVLVMQCRTCEAIKPISAFRKAGDNYYGLQVNCKVCRAASKPYYEPVTTGTKWCPRCKTQKPVWLFPVHYQRVDGREKYCRLCKEKSLKQYHNQRPPKTTERIAQIRREQTLALSIEMELNHVPDVDIKRCGQCGFVKELHYFYPAKQNVDGCNARCKDCCTGRTSTHSLEISS